MDAVDPPIASFGCHRLLALPGNHHAVSAVEAVQHDLATSQQHDYCTQTSQTAREVLAFMVRPFAIPVGFIPARVDYEGRHWWLSSSCISPAVDAGDGMQTRSATEPTDTGEIICPFSPEQPANSAEKGRRFFVRWRFTLVASAAANQLADEFTHMERHMSNRQWLRETSAGDGLSVSSPWGVSDLDYPRALATFQAAIIIPLKWLSFP
jgi:hypothetical protein